MKSIYPPIAFACVLSFPALAGLAPPIGPATVNLSCAAQDLNYQPVRTNGNVVRSITNATIISKSTVTNFTLDASSFLDLITNSLKTTFPAGARLLLFGSQGDYSFAVSDSTGTNLAMYVNPPLLGLTFESGRNAGKKTETTTNDIVSSGNDTEAFISEVRFTYNDRTNSTDGTLTDFTLNCLVEAKSSRNLATDTDNVTMTVIGDGQIRGGPPVVITGTIRAKITGIVPGG